MASLTSTSTSTAPVAPVTVSAMPKPPSATFQLPEARRVAMLERLRKAKKSSPHDDPQTSRDSPLPTPSQPTNEGAHPSMDKAHADNLRPCEIPFDVVPPRDSDADDAREEDDSTEEDEDDEDDEDEPHTQLDPRLKAYADRLRQHQQQQHQQQQEYYAASSSPPTHHYRDSLSSPSHISSVYSSRSPLSSTQSFISSSSSSSTSFSHSGGGFGSSEVHHLSSLSLGDAASTVSRIPWPSPPPATVANYTLIPICTFRREELLTRYTGSTIRDLCPICDASGARVPIGLHTGVTDQQHQQQQQPPSSSSDPLSTRAYEEELSRVGASRDASRRSISHPTRHSFSLPHTTRRASISSVSVETPRLVPVSSPSPTLGGVGVGDDFDLRRPSLDRARSTSSTTSQTRSLEAAMAMTPDQIAAEEKAWWSWLHETV